MKRAFRKYHRTLAVILCLPIALTAITGMLATVVREWSFLNTGLSSNLIMRIHTGEIFHLESIYPMLNGLGLIGMLVTGMSMSGLFGKSRPMKNQAK
ncbi:MAG TPA: peptidase [Coleofasciculaceae cyanobacterium]